MPSDYGHEQTDKLLKELEKRIDKEYSQAAKEVQEKFYAHMKDFERKDAKMQEKLDAGKITEKEYQNWRTNQMLTGQRMNALYESLAKDLVNADQIAAGMINDSLPDVYALNMNYSTYKIEHTTEIDTNFTLYDRKTVENLMKDNPRIIPHLTEKQAARIKKDELWNRQHLVSAVAQGILQGEGIPDIAKRLQTVAAMDDNAATRNARTYITAAQNKGRIDSYERAEKLGIETNKKWIATLDDRTRVEHRHLDGVSIPYSDVFKMDGYEIEYPGDPSAEPEMIYNCRCTLVDDIKNWPYNDERRDEKLGDMTYEQWKHAKDKKINESIVNISARDFIGDPIIRPMKTDYENIDDFYAAREKYRADKEEQKTRADEWYYKNIDTNPMSIDEFSDWAKKNNVIIYGNLDGVDDVTLRNYAKRYEELSRDFPIVEKMHQRMNRPFEIAYNPNGLYDAEASHGMTFGRTYSDFYENFISTVQTDGFVFGVNPAIKTFDHEFGHQVYDALKYGMDKEIGNSTIDEINRRQKLERDLIDNVYGKSGMSEYATTNDDELFAEAFCAWYGGENSEFANSFGEFLRRWM